MSYFIIEELTSKPCCNKILSYNAIPKIEYGEEIFEDLTAQDTEPDLNIEGKCHHCQKSVTYNRHYVSSDYKECKQ